MRITFVGETFPAARAALAGLLPDDEIAAAAPDAIGPADVIVPAMGRVDAALMDRAEPRLVQQFGVGLEGVDLAAAAARRIPVANVPAADTGNAAAVAEIAVLHLLALLRRSSEATAALRAGRLGEPVGRSLVGLGVVLVGLGAIGREIALRLAPFGVRLTGVGRRPPAEVGAAVRALPLAAYHRSAELKEALAGADVVVLAAALTPETRGMIGEAELAAMPPGGWLVNVARGALVDRAALLGALRSGHLAGAGLDVFAEEPVDPEDPLLAENVSATPHLGAVTRESYAAMARAVAANVERLRRGEPLRNLVRGPP